MQPESIDVTAAAFWASAVCIAGVFGNLNSPSGWTVVAGLGILPSLVMMWRWNDARQTMSQTIQKALR